MAQNLPLLLAVARATGSKQGFPQPHADPWKVCHSPVKLCQTTVAATNSRDTRAKNRSRDTYQTRDPSRAQSC